MSQPSRLDQTPNINSRFNQAGDVENEKRFAQYQLAPEERQQLTELKQNCDKQTAQEKESFADPKERKERFDQKYAEVAQRNQVPTPEHFPPGARNRTMPRSQLIQVADVGIKQDHANKLKEFQNDYRSGMNDVLKKAAEQGRGPQPNQQQDRDQNQERNSTPSQDFNRAADNDRDR